jgi:hypothetical protein
VAVEKLIYSKNSSYIFHFFFNLPAKPLFDSRGSAGIPYI